MATGMLMCGCGPRQPAVLGPVLGASPPEAIPPTQRTYVASILYSQTWRDGVNDPDLFRVSGGDRPRPLEMGQYLVPARITAGMGGVVFVSDDAAGRTRKLTADGKLSDSITRGWVLGTDRSGNEYLHTEEQGISLTSIGAGGVENYSIRLEVGWIIYDVTVSPCGLTQVLYSSPDGTGDRLIEVSPSGQASQPVASDDFGIRYEGPQGEWYKLQCPEIGRLQLCRLSGSRVRPLVELLFEQEAWESRFPLGMDDAGRFYFFFNVQETSSLGRRGWHYYVQVVDPKAPETWLVDLGFDPGLTSPAYYKAAVDRQGTIYFLMTDMSGMKVLTYRLDEAGG